MNLERVRLDPMAKLVEFEMHRVYHHENWKLLLRRHHALVGGVGGGRRSDNLEKEAYSLYRLGMPMKEILKQLWKRRVI